MAERMERDKPSLAVRAAAPIALLGVVAAAICGVLALTKGLVWILPMALCLSLGLGPLGYRMVIGRAALLRALAATPARRYRLPYGAAAGATPLSASIEHWAASRVRVSPWRDVGPLGERAALGQHFAAGPRRALVRLRYLGAPYDACVPAVVVRSGEGCAAIARSGPAAVIIAEFPLEAWEWALHYGDAAWEAAEGAARRADGSRPADLEALGAADVVPEAAADLALGESGYERIGTVPLVALADSLTLAELEFAWPESASFRVERFGGVVTPAGYGLDGLHAEGCRPTRDGEVRLDLVIVRTADDLTAAYIRREQERRPAEDAP